MATNTQIETEEKKIELGAVWLSVRRFSKTFPSAAVAIAVFSGWWISTTLKEGRKAIDESKKQ